MAEDKIADIQQTICGLQAQHVGQETVLAQIVKTEADAQRSRAPIQNLADRVSSVFVPIVLAISMLTFAAWFV